MDEQSIDAVMARCKQMASEDSLLFTPLLLVDMDEKAVYRVVGGSLAGYRAVDNAEERDIGKLTEAAFFDELQSVGEEITGTQEIAE